MFSRRNLFRTGAAGLALSPLIFAALRPGFARMHTPAFDANGYTELTETVTTGAGERSVTYRFYKAIPYVANPVDVAYESLNISVPTAIQGVAVNAENAPILLANPVGVTCPQATRKPKASAEVA